MVFPYKVVSISEEETIDLAKEFVQTLEPNILVVLNGDLGTGKTFFIKNVLKCFDITNVNSPTFAIVNEYDAKWKIYHFDFYRIEKESELIDIGISDYFNDESSISFIEWGSLFPNLLPKKRIEINISYTTGNSRLFEFIKYE
jgi:tRNA threonylcarbamoyladenosine biosynthesis protein TsaE